MSDILDSTVVDAEHPWPGLMPFSEDAHRFFHGRDAEAAELLRLIKRETLTVLFGQSGLGKSSLLNAGLFPRLRAEDFLPIYVRLDVSERAPPFADQVRTALIENCRVHRVDARPPRAEESLWGYFHHRDTDFWSARNRLLTPVLVFDQFEEIFTLGRHFEALEARCRAFLEDVADLIEDRMPASLAALVEADPGIGDELDYAKRGYKVVFSFREDYLPEFEGLRSVIRPIMQNRMRLTRMSGEQALGAILQAGGHLVPEDVAATVVRFVAAPRVGRSDDDLARLEVEPALMSVVCRELNNHRLRGRRQQITADILQSGAQQRIIQDFYDASLRDVDARVRAFVEDQLLTDAGYRDSCALEDALAMPGVTRDAIDLLIGRRLLRLEERSGVLRVEFTHDVLTQVARQSRDRRKQEEAERDRLEKEAVRRGKNRRLAFAGGAAFALMVAIAVTFAVLLNRANDERRRLIETQSFIALSRANAALEQGVPGEPYAMLAQAIRLNPDNRAAVSRAVSLLVQRRYARLLAHTALSTPADAAWYDAQNFAVFGSKAMAWLGRGDFTAEILEVRSSGNDYEDVGLAELAVRERAELSAIAFSGETAATGPDAHASRRTLAYQAEARVVPYLSGNYMLHLFDPRTRMPVGKPLQLAGKPAALAVSPGRKWAVAVVQGNVFLARLDAQFEASAKLSAVGLKGDVSIGFVTDSGALVLRGEDSAVFLRPALQGQAGFAPAMQMQGAVSVARANAAGTLFAVAVRGDAQVYDALTGAAIGRKMSHPSTVRDLAFSPDGRYLATGCLDKQARLWDAQTQILAGPPMKHSGAVLSVRFGADAQTLATGAADGAARVWQPFRGELLAEPMIHPDPVAEVMPQPSGDHLVALTNGQELYFWRWRHAEQAAQRRVGFTSGTTALAASTDGARAAFGSAQGDVAVFATGQGKDDARWTTPGAAAAVTSLQFSPDGGRLAAAWLDGEVVVFDSASGRPLGKPLVHAQAVRLIQFSPDGKLLATASQDRLVRIWDVAQQRLAAFSISRNTLVTGLAFSPDGGTLLLVERNRVSLWEASSSAKLGETELGGGARLLTAEFSGDGKAVVAVLTDRVLRLPLEQTADGRPGLPKTAQQAQGLALGDFNAWSAAIAPDRLQAALGALDGRVRIVDLAGLRFVGESMRHDDAVLGLSYAADGRTLASWSRDRSLRVWYTSSGHAVADAMTADSETALARFVDGGAGIAIGLAQGGGYIQALGRPPQAAAPSWLPELLELVGGTHIDGSGNTKRLTDRSRVLRTFAATLPSGDEAWRRMALRIVELIGPEAPVAERKE